jgi:hypothetical protein
MLPMTMIFNVKNQPLLKDLNAGDLMTFVALSESGKLYVTELKRENENGPHSFKCKWRDLWAIE